MKLGIDLCNKHQIGISEQDYLILGKTYRSLNINDSARYYLNKATTTKNIYTSRGAYLDLFYLNNKEKQYGYNYEYGLTNKNIDELLNIL